MVKRTNLRPDPAQAMSTLVEKLTQAAKDKNTKPSGVKDLGTEGDVVWTRPEDPDVALSMRELDFTLEGTKEELAQAVATLAELNGVTIPQLEEALDGLGDLDEIRDELEGLGDLSGLGRVTTVGPPPSDPVLGQTIWIAPNGRMFRAVECKEDD